METVGEILKNAREKKGLTIESLEKKTRIVSRYIEALENNEFDKLPGEIYVKGFIKTISDKLLLDSDKVLERYNLQINEDRFEEDLYKSDKNAKPTKKEKESKVKKEKKIEDSAISSSEATNIEIEKAAISNVNEEFNKVKPKIRSNISNAESDLLATTRRDLDRLRSRRKSFPIVPVIVVLAILVIFAVIVVFFIRRKNNNDNRKNEVEIVRNIVNNSVSRQNVKSGDIINFKPLGISANIKFNSIGNAIHLNINGQDLTLSKGSPIILDLSGNGIDDFKISVIEIYDNLATVEMEKLEENQMINAGIVYSNNNFSNNIQNTTAIASNFQVIDGDTYIMRNVEKEDIKIEITAKQFVYVRYFIDSGAPATQNLLSGKTINLTASDVIMLTIGNAGEVIVKVNGNIVNVGEAGETVNKTIKWIRDIGDSTKYNLIMSDTR
ncbi:helix-turn-helix domain-containing protein [Brachyspira aalborgi]|uniref:helix-turn-helix domain-containing protein n=1 Tax=Brachyspira aalborgi TaxID=29522 RepID=UPI0011C9049B|nr:helix-turn-helix domain-containing protein [Brachyspira aalborgi]TXJ16357.1 helix-turn-helix domain-containing protein [Brachyspira aalborgi]TXJ21938.1 helix-turn-helix domain-containing protein [Brachyspira aalborgi]TXJ49938.1 helix-turn-helix domain-containing protein [Brachyspira aalborgi]